MSWGGPDLKFKNATDSWLLISVSYTSSSITISLYGTDPGYKVTSKTSAFSNERPFPTEKIKDPKLDEGVKVIDDPGVEGKTCTVTQNGQEGRQGHPHRHLHVGLPPEDRNRQSGYEADIVERRRPRKRRGRRRASDARVARRRGERGGGSVYQPELESMTREQLEELQLERLQKLLKTRLPQRRALPRQVR